MKNEYSATAVTKYSTYGNLYRLCTRACVCTTRTRRFHFNDEWFPFPLTCTFPAFERKRESISPLELSFFFFNKEVRPLKFSCAARRFEQSRWREEKLDERNARWNPFARSEINEPRISASLGISKNLSLTEREGGTRNGRDNKRGREGGEGSGSRVVAGRIVKLSREIAVI